MENLKSKLTAKDREISERELAAKQKESQLKQILLEFKKLA
jgi:hypothetical protein